ncbi:methyltransferase [Aliamphritea spongicola]|nr:methyltransferase [Aliamphritea spongicola]
MPPGPAKVADLGTGTGAIALALATERPAWQVFAVDFVADAAELAEQNRQTLGLSNVTVLQGSWLEPVSEELHMVVSNPPYIDPEDPHLKQEMSVLSRFLRWWQMIMVWRISGPFQPRRGSS